MSGKDAQRTAPPKEHVLRSSLDKSAAETYNLSQTLNGYEVEELDDSDLARFLPTIVVDEESGDEFDPEEAP